MDEPLDNPELPDWDPQPIEDAATAERALRQLARTRRRLAANLRTYQALMAEAENWEVEVNGPLRAEVESLEGFVGRWWLEELAKQEAEDPRAPKTQTLPSGVVKAKPSLPSVEVQNEAAFLEWAEDAFPDLVRTTEPKPPERHPDKNAIKAALGELLRTATEPDAEGTPVLFGEAGEPVPGIVVVKPPRTVEIST